MQSINSQSIFDRSLLGSSDTSLERLKLLPSNQDAATMLLNILATIIDSPLKAKLLGFNEIDNTIIIILVPNSDFKQELIAKDLEQIINLQDFLLKEIFKLDTEQTKYRVVFIADSSKIILNGITIKKLLELPEKLLTHENFEKQYMLVMNPILGRILNKYIVTALGSDGNKFYIGQNMSEILEIFCTNSKS